MDRKQIEIRNLSLEEVDQIAKIHINAFQESLISKLGTKVTKAYYKWQFESPDDVYSIGAFIDNRLVGFSFGGIFKMALGGFIANNRKLVFSQILLHPWVLLHPHFTKKILLGLRLFFLFPKKGHQNKFQNAEFSKKGKPYFGILSIAINSSARGKGVGRLLMERTETLAKENEFRKMLLSVDPNNKNAVDFYLHLGWEKEMLTTEWNGKMIKFI